MLKQSSGVLLAAAALAAAGCGSTSASPGATSAPAATTATKVHAGVSDHDAQILVGWHAQIKRWNSVAGKWSTALGGDDLTHFLAVKDRYAAQLNRVVAHLMVDPTRIEDSRLRSMLERIGRAYNGQFGRLVDVNSALAEGDVASAQRAIKAMHKAGLRKNVLAQRLTDAYPELS